MLIYLRFLFPILPLSFASCLNASIFGTDVPGDGSLNCFPRTSCPTLVGQASSPALAGSPVNLSAGASTLSVQLASGAVVLSFSGVNNAVVGPLGLNPLYNPSKNSSITGDASRDATIPVSGQRLTINIKNTGAATISELDFYLQNMATVLPNGQQDGLTFGAYCTGAPDSGQCSQRSFLALLQTPTGPGALNSQDTAASLLTDSTQPNPTFGDRLRFTQVNLAPNATATFTFYVTDNNGTRAASTGGTQPNAAFTLQIVPLSGLGISKTHHGNFARGQQGAGYTLTVSNPAGATPTSGTVSVTDTPPPGLTLASMSGAGWNCGSGVCTRNDSLAAGASYPPIAVRVNVTAAATSPQVNTAAVSGGGAQPSSVTDSAVILQNPIRDFLNNGRSDVLLYDSNGKYGYTGLSSGNGVFSYVFSYLMSGFDQLKTGDFSGSGRAGLIVYNSVQALAFFGASNGDGTFTFSPLYWSPGFNVVETGDINGDGKTDVLLYRPADGTLYAALGNGAGAFTYVYSLVQPNFSQVKLGDFNGDGKADLLVYKPNGACFLGIGDGGGTFNFSPVTVSPGFTDLQLGDFNGDGLTDILFYNAATGMTSVGLSTGAGFTFQTYGFSPGFTAARVGDFTGDGKADLIFYNGNTAVAYFGTGNGAGGFSFQSLFWSPGYDWVEPQDLNGDGRLDVVLYNSSTGTAYTGLSNGAGGFTYTYSYWGIGKALAR